MWGGITQGNLLKPSLELETSLSNSKGDSSIIVCQTFKIFRKMEVLNDGLILEISFNFYKKLCQCLRSVVVCSTIFGIPQQSYIFLLILTKEFST